MDIPLIPFSSMHMLVYSLALSEADYFLFVDFVSNINANIVIYN